MTDNVDMSKTIIAKSDQLNSDDLLGGTLTGTITRVFATGSAEQPVGIDIDTWPQPWKPSKGMRRVLVECWGVRGDDYVGRSVRLCRNPDVKYGGIAVGGIEIVALSHIDKPHAIPLTVSRGKKKPFVVDVLRAESSAKTKSEPKKEKPPEPPATDTMLLTAFADLCVALQAVKSQSELDSYLVECTHLKPSLDTKSITTLADLVKSAKARIAPKPATGEPTDAQTELANTQAKLINGTKVPQLLEGFRSNVADYLSGGELTAHQAEALIGLIDEKLGAA